MGIDVVLIQAAFGAGEVRALNSSASPIGRAYIAAFLRGHGHHVTILDAEVEQLNEGEHTMLDIVSSIESGGTFDFNGVTYRDADAVSKNPDRKLIVDLDAPGFQEDITE